MAPIAVSANSSLATSSVPPKFLPHDARLAILDHLTKKDNLAPLTALLETQLTKEGWKDRVRELSLELLRSGECQTYEQVMAEVVRRAGGGAWGKEDADSKRIGGDRIDEIDVKVPKVAVEKGVKYVKASLRGAVEVVGEDGGKKGKSNGVEKRNGV
ncbi:MAG: hypothetical protein Q9160_003379 [Pyrenula sp. 1 TL-2023]